jgi:glycosyltransferase involved in cell wall biosynthesis
MKSTHEEDISHLPLVLHTRVVTGAGGGPEKTILNSPRCLPPLGYRSICAYMRAPKDAGFEAIRQRAKQWQAPLMEIDDAGALDLSIFRRYLQICREQNVAIWHGHDSKSNLIGLWVNRYWPMKLVSTVHGWVTHTWRLKVYKIIDLFCLKRYEQVICVSDDLQATCLKAGVRKDRCHWINNAIDTTQFRRSLSILEAKQKFGLDPSRRLIGAVGRLSVEKGFDILVRAVQHLLAAGLNVELIIVGEGDERKRLESQIAELNLQDRIKLLGFRSDTVELYQAFDLFALSSYREGLPNVLLEAMALEVPVVSTNVAGIPKLVTHQQDGLLVEPGQPESLANAMQSVLENSPLSRSLSQAARKTIEDKFSFDRRMEKVARVYDLVLPRQ